MFKKYTCNICNGVLVACGVISIILPVVTIAIFSYKRAVFKVTFVAKIGQHVGAYIQRGLEKAPFYIKEIYKIVTAGSGVILISGLVFVTIYFCVDSRMYYSQEQLMLDKRYIERGGNDYEDYKAEVLSIRDELLSLNAQKMEIIKNNDEVYKVEGFYELIDKVDAAEKKMRAYAEVYTKLEYLDTLKETRGIDGYLMSDRGYEEVIGKYGLSRWGKLLFALSAVVVLMISECFHKEYSTGMSDLTRTSRNGRLRFYISKIIACGLTATFLYSIVCVIDGIYINSYYTLPYMEAPVQSLTFMENCQLNISIGEYIIWQYIIVYVFVLLFTVLISTVMLYVRDRNEKPYLFGVMVIALIVSNSVLAIGVRAPLISVVCMFGIAGLVVIVGKELWCNRYKA